MVRVCFTATNLGEIGVPFTFAYVDPVDYDLVSDPMTVTTFAIGYDSDGNPVDGESVKEFHKSAYIGEVIEEVA